MTARQFQFRHRLPYTIELVSSFGMWKRSIPGLRSSLTLLRSVLGIQHAELGEHALGG